VVVSESATTGAVLFFGGLAVLSLLLFSGIACALIAGYFAAWSLYAAVASDFIADRSRGELLVRRKIGPWSITRAYRAETIDRVYVRRTIKGSGLALRFKSGRTKGLTMSLGSEAQLERSSGALNYFLHISRGGGFR
jgi:hypothetical protein